ncbi:hypothetical protein [Thiomonas intermedia]|uniref:hypothetical protein n=1 Tax=Thiomonas intermedia TaxID=926 RepID=UPI0009A4BD44|nr:hypothetical protein [Thiomonas intermedia]
MQRRTFIIATALGATLAWPGMATATPLGAGDTLPQTSFEDQHGKTETFPGADTRVVLFAVEKAPSDVVNDYLTTLGAEAMRQRGIVFLANISGMPGFVTQTFALPKMRKRPYAILLATKAEQCAFMPHEKNAVTVVQLRQGKITQIQFARDAAALKSAIGGN